MRSNHRHTLSSEESSKLPSGRSPGSAYKGATRPSRAQAQWLDERRRSIFRGLTVAVTTRDLHPLPYSPAASLSAWRQAPEGLDKEQTRKLSRNEGES